MDENSCVNETSKSVENAVKGQKTNNSENELELEKVGIAVGGKPSQNKVLNRCSSSSDASGPSTNVIVREIPNTVKDEKAELTPVDKPVESFITSEANEPAVAEPSAAIEEREPEQHSTAEEENTNDSLVVSNHEDGQSVQPRVRIDPLLNEQQPAKKLSIGPPPSYSFVMKQKKKLKFLPSPDPSIINRPPPPNYANTRGLFVTTQESPMERICNLPSFVEPVWRAHSQPALCARCGVIVLTTTHSHDSVATHIAALVLCLLGCWPCCLLPYCMSVCKNNYHYCPICQACLGLYTPCARFLPQRYWQQNEQYLADSHTVQASGKYLENQLSHLSRFMRKCF